MFLADYKKSRVLPVCAAFEYLWVCISHHPLPSWAQYLWKDGHKSSHAEQNNKSFPPCSSKILTLQLSLDLTSQRFDLVSKSLELFLHICAKDQKQ